MEQRFAVRKQELLAGAEIKTQVSAELLQRLPEFLAPYLVCMGRSEQKAHLQTYLQGLVSDLARKNVEAIAYLHDQERNELQHFIGGSRWEHAPLLAELTKQVGLELGEADGVIVFDPSGFEKDGKDSVGVQRQWLGRLGKVENGQVGVYLGYASRKGYALCDARLYLPKEWAADRGRRRKSGVPKGVRFQTRQELAKALLLERGAFLPHQWVTGDDEMGRGASFRAWLRERGEQYLLAVPSNTSMRDLAAEAPAGQGPGRKRKTPFLAVSRWRTALPAAAWTRLEVRDGEKGPLVVEAAKGRVQARAEKQRVGPEELLVVLRVPEAGGWRTDYYLSNAPAETPLAELARVAKAEHNIEDCFKRAKSEAGLADYEVRTWRGWHHHQTLSLLATWFLTHEAQRGKKMDAGAYGAAVTDAHGPVAA